jgi:hypothetical protein
MKLKSVEPNAWKTSEALQIRLCTYLHQTYTLKLIAEFRNYIMLRTHIPATPIILEIRNLYETD